MNESFKGGRSLVQYGTVKDEKISLFGLALKEFQFQRHLFPVKEEVKMTVPNRLPSW